MSSTTDPLHLENDILAAADGSHEAFARIVRATQNMVTGIALAIVGDRAASHDIAQETYWTVWNKLSTLANPASFLPWLRTITRNRARNWLDSAQRRQRHFRQTEELGLVADTAPSPVEQMETDEQQATLSRLLSELPAETREILILYYREGQSTRQVAALLDLSEEAVRQRLSRARKKLRHLWETEVGRWERESRPHAGFALAVMGGLTSSTPAIGQAAAAKTLAKTAATTPLWKTALLFVSSTVIPALVGVAAVVLGMRVELRRAASETEKNQLRRIRACAIALVCLAALMISTGGALQIVALPIAAYVMLIAGLAILYLVWLPRVIAERLRQEVANDPTRAAVHRREHRCRWIGLLAGAVGGGLGLLFGLGLIG